MADQKTLTSDETQAARARNSRRGFLRTAGGVAAGTALFVAGCDNGGPLSGNQAPTASLTATPGDDMTVTFTPTFGDDDLDGQDAFDESLTARIELGNGDEILDSEITSGEPVTRTFDSAGQYTATLIVTDGGGATARDTATFMVGMGVPQYTLDFSSPIGVLNYAYALEQLEAAFYARTVQAIEDGEFMTNSQEETDYFDDLLAHEAIHRDFLAAAIPAQDGASMDDLLPDLAPYLNLEDVTDFSDRSSVLGMAQTLEDTGVSAYNGAGVYLSESPLLTIAGQIVSVEGRHAAAIRALNSDNNTAFADLTNLTGLGANTEFSLDVAQSPDDVLASVVDLGLISGINIMPSNT